MEWPDIRDQQFRLNDQRALGFAEYGDPNGWPIFYFHGWPGSRIEASILQPIALAHRMRVIAVDRPGLGLSDCQRGRRILDWPTDLLALADHLGLERFAIIAASGGGPYGLICAARFPERLTTVALVSALGPLDAPGALQGMIWHNRLLIRVGRRAPWLAALIIAWVARGMRQHPDRVFAPTFLRRLPAPDQEAITQPIFRQALSRSIREAFRGGVHGPVWDGLLYVRPWGFSVSEIRAPVRLWQGELDVHVPSTMGRWLAQNVPKCRATFCPGEGHLSLPLNRADEILEALRSDRSLT